MRRNAAFEPAEVRGVRLTKGDIVVAEHVARRFHGKAGDAQNKNLAVEPWMILPRL
jgi:hypothetical protein